MNHLRVDLILESERRSTSPVSLRFLLRAAAMAALVIIALLGVFFLVKVKTTQMRKSNLTAEWARIEPRLKDVRELQRGVDRNQEILGEVQGWNRARIPWHQHLADLQKIVPETIQIASLRVSDQLLMIGKSAALAYNVRLEGRAEGRNPREDVDTLLRLVKNGEGFSGMVEGASVEEGSFRVAPDAKDHRLFAIAVKYKARSLQ